MSLRSQLLSATAITASASHLRLPMIQTQYAFYNSVMPKIKTNMVFTQYGFYQLTKPGIKTNMVLTQFIQTAPETSMATEILPELNGVSIEVNLKPMFKTKIAEHTSGAETRTQYWQYPRYDIELSYDYLPNKEKTAQTSLKKLIGFFNERCGSFEEFLFKVPEFNRVENRLLVVGDGQQNEITLVDQIGAFLQPIGQVDDVTISLKAQVVERRPAEALTTLIYPNDVSGLIVRRVSDSTIYTVTTGTPGATTYRFIEETGQIVFSAGNVGVQFDFTYAAVLSQGTEYSVLLPNIVVLQNAPPVGVSITGTYDYWFIVRFLDDQTEYSRFADRLWEMQELSLRSIAS